MIAVYEWTLADGTPTGLGTELEFNHWSSEGVLPEGSKLGRVLGYEAPGMDERRKKQWGIAA